MCVCVFQIEDIRTSIDKIDESVTEIKKLYSTILSAPTSDQSECFSLMKYTYIYIYWQKLQSVKQPLYSALWNVK